MLNPVRTLRVLLVEDQDADAELLMATLRSYGHGYDWTRVQTEADYREGLDAGPDIVLSDYHLPRFSGLRALAILRERGLDIPFILVSGAVSEAEAAEVLQQGADDILAKDQLNRLPAVIQVALERRRLRDTLQQNEARLQAFLENSPAPTFIKDTAGRYLHANPRFLQAFGLNEDAVLGRTDAEIFGGAQAAEFQGHDRQVLEAGAAMTFEEHALYVDGLHSSLVTKFPLRNSFGAIYALGGIATDITERNAAEQRHRATLEHAPIGIVHTALDGGIIDANPATCAILGYARSELLGRSLIDITHPADRETAIQLRQELIAGGIDSTSSREKRYVRKDGTVIWATASVALVRKPDGSPDYFIAMVQDVSGRRAAEQQFRTTFEQATVGIVHTTLDDCYLLANERFCGMLGYSQEEIRGMRTSDVVHPEDKGKDLLQRQQLLSGEINSFSGEKRYRRKDGSLIWVNRTVSLARDEDGKPLYLIRVVEDITRRKEEEELFSATFEQAGVGITLRRPGDRTTGWLRVNQKLCDMLGYTREELMRLSPADITLPEDQDEAYEYNLRIGRGEIPGYTRERRYRRKDGSIIWCNLSISAVCGPDGKPSHVVGVLQDVTARKEAEARLEQTFEQAAVGIVRVDFDSRILEVNQKFCEMTGYDRDSLLQMNLKQVSHPDDSGMDTAARTRLLAGEIDSFSSEKRYLLKDGSLIWVRRTTSLARDIADGKPHFVLVVEDITARRKAEDSYRATFETAPVGIMHTGFDRRILDVNPKACEILGYTREELLRMTTADILTPEYLESDRPHYLQQMLNNELKVFSSQRPYRRKDGSLVWTNRSVSLVRDSAGEPLYFLRMMEDISERKKVEDALAQERLLLRTVIDALPERIYVRDLKGRIILPNAAYLKIRGFERHEDVIGKSVDELFPPDMAKRYREEDQKVIDSGEPMADRETRTYTSEKGYSDHWHLTSKVPLKDATGRVFGLVGINRDITTRKLAEMRIMRLNRFFSTLSATNAAIMRTRDRDSLFRAVCRIAVSDGGLGSAWVRLHEPGTEELKVVAYAGVSRHYFNDLRVSTNPALPKAGDSRAAPSAKTG